MKREFKRQAIHALGALSIIVIAVFGKALSIVLFSVWIAILIITSEFRKNRSKFRKHPLFRLYIINFFETIGHKFILERERKGEYSLRGPITYFLGSLIAVILFPELIAVIAILILSIADAASTLVGKSYGIHKLRINSKKSWEGSITFFIASLMILYLFLDPLKALTIAITVSVVEMLPDMDDNITIPIATGLLLYLFI